MGSYFSVALDCHDPHRLAAFYGALLDLPVVFEAGAYVVLRPAAPDSGAFIFQQVAEDAAGKNRAHVDLHVASLEGATALALELGGLRGEDVHEIGMHWRTMNDPEGNVFCLMEGSP